MSGPLPSAVDPDTRELRYTSPSQIKTIDAQSEGGCPRKWYFEKVMGMKAPPTASQLKGTAIHAEVEEYLKTGRDMLSTVARAAKAILPAPGADLIIETSLETMVRLKPPKVESLVEAAGVPVVGRIDVVNPRDLKTLKTVDIGDHKTTKHRKYMKTPAQLALDPQMLAYGMYVKAKYPEAERVRLIHNYIGTGSCWAEKVQTEGLLTTVQERWESRVTPVVDLQKQVARAVTFADVPTNINACDAYGGCPHIQVCKPKRNPFRRTEVNTVSLANMLSKKPAPPAPTPAVVPVAKAPATTLPAPAAQGISGAKYSSQQQEILHIDEDGNPVPATKKQLVIEDKLPETFTAPKVLPNDAPKSDPVLAAEGTEGQYYQAPDGQWFLWSTEKGSRAWRLSNGPPAATEIVLEKPKKRGLKPKGETVPIVAQSPTPSTTPVVDRSAPEQPIDAPRPAEVVVLFNAWISKGYTDSFSNYVDGIAKGVAEEYGAVDIRCSEHDALKFGKWKGVLAASIRALPPDAGRYAYFGTSELYAVAADTVGEFGVVIKGVAAP